MTLPATCTLERTDTAGDPNAHYLWGEYSCAPRRVAWNPAGGDPRPTAVGAPQGNSAFRELTVVDGDNPCGYGERCELAKNSYVDGLASFQNPLGTFYNYDEGARRATYMSIRLPSNFPIGIRRVAERHADETIGSLKRQRRDASTLSADLRQPLPPVPHPGRLGRGRQQLWSPDPGQNPEAVAHVGVWYRIAIDALYSQDPDRGWVKMYIDLNGDGDFDDPEEQSPVFGGSALEGTLKTEPAPQPGNPDVPGNGQDIGPPTGAPVPSHLRAGIYHNPSDPLSERLFG